jgi:diaminopimelate decarboxylase
MPSLHHAAAMRVDPDLWPLTTRVDVEGRLCVGGVALSEIADQYGTPAYILDEADFRYRIRRYRAALPGVRTGLG